MIDIRLGDSLLIELDRSCTGRVVVNGVEIKDVTRIKFDLDIDKDGFFTKVETDVELKPLVATIEHLVSF